LSKTENEGRPTQDDASSPPLGESPEVTDPPIEASSSFAAQDRTEERLGLLQRSCGSDLCLCWYVVMGEAECHWSAMQPWT